MARLTRNIRCSATKMQTALDKFRLDGLGLDVGHTTRDMHCPKCGHKQDIAVTRVNNGFLYRCFRATCNAKGFVPASGKADTKRVQVSKKERIFQAPTTELSHVQILKLQSKYPAGPTRDELIRNGVLWCPSQGRVIFPCFTKHGAVWGHIARRYEFLDDEDKSQGEAKTLTYKAQADAVSVSWPRRPSIAIAKGQENKVILVEDVMSAVLMARSFTTIALLGHHIPKELWGELKNYHVVLALDPDVRSKSAKYVKDFGMFAQKVSSVYPEKDPKDLNHLELAALRNEIYKL